MLDAGRIVHDSMIRLILAPPEPRSLIILTKLTECHTYCDATLHDVFAIGLRDCMAAHLRGPTELAQIEPIRQ